MWTRRNRPPALGPIFGPEVRALLGTGFFYQPGEALVLGTNRHHAIDLEVDRGTPVLAPFDGFYLATYGEYLQVDKSGQPKMLGYDQALHCNPYGNDILVPPGDDPWMYYLGSYLVQGWNPEHQLYVQLAHLDMVAEMIPYHPATPAENRHGTGDLQHSQMLRANWHLYFEAHNAAFLRAGALIGTSGMTGCGWGGRCIDLAQRGKDGRPIFSNVSYPHYTTPHVHLAVLDAKRRPIDPFGIYGNAEQYPRTSDVEWHGQLPSARHTSLWLPPRTA